MIVSKKLIKTSKIISNINYNYKVPSMSLFQQTANLSNRFFPEGLELCAVLGSKFAEEKINSFEKERVLKIIEEKKKDFKGNNLCFSYLNALRALLDKPETNAPKFMKSDAWKAKSCNTVLAGWTMFQDTWHFKTKKQTDWEYLCSREYCYSPPIGFVEPVPEFFNRMANLARKTKRFLNGTGIFETNNNFELKKLWVKFEDISQKLESIAHKQIHGIKLIKSENMLFGTYGKDIAKIMFYDGILDEELNDDSPRIVDVFSNSEKGGYLHVGISRPRKINVLYPWKGKDILCVGAVLPYYEFVNNSRLTDSDWKKMLDSNSRPPILRWQEPIINGGKLTKPDLKDLRE